MKRKIIAASLLVLLIFSTTVVEAETININLKKAVNMALENNLKLQEAKIGLEKSKLEYKKNMANNLTTQSDYNELNAKYQLKNAEISYKNTYDSLIKNIVKQYNNLVLSKYNLEVLSKRKELENKLLEESKAKYEIGDIGNISLLEQKNKYQDSRYNYRSAKDNYEQSLREFKTTLGIGRSNELKFEGLSDLEIWEVNEDEVVDKTIANSLSLELKEMNFKLAKLDKKRTEISASKIDREIAAKTVEKAKVSKERTKSELENSSVLAYHDYQQSIEEMKLKKNDFEKAKKDYILKKEQYNEGLLTESELLNYKINKMQAEHDYLSALVNHYNKLISLKQKMNIELEVVNDGSK